MAFHILHLFLAATVIASSLAVETSGCANIDCFLSGVSEATSLQRLRFLVLDEPVLMPARLIMHYLIRDIRSENQPTDAEIADRLVPMRDSFLSIVTGTCGMELDERETDFIERAFLDASDVRSLLKVLIRLKSEDHNSELS